MNEIIPGSKWRGSDYAVFFVVKVEERDQGTWVFYRRAKDNAEFNCLVGAFLHRFQEDRSYG